MRWDDLELLQLIDQLEQSDQGPLWSGFSLMQGASSGKPLDPNQDYRPFVRELLLAQAAGFLTWKEQFSYGGRPAGADLDPNLWLQQISEIRLTLAGRDRAHGRVIIRPLPDPDEDDDRPIYGTMLEEIARAIGDVFTPAQIPRFLRESGVPDEYVPQDLTGSKWQYLLQVFENLHEGGSAARRAIREFIGHWLDNLLHTLPQEAIRKRVEVQLAPQGWQVREHRLVIGERRLAVPEKILRASRRARIAMLHPIVQQAANRYHEMDALEVAIFEAFKAVNGRVRELSKLPLDGSELMSKAFQDVDPPIRLANLSTDTGRNIQAGFRFLFMGAVRGIRNPDAHDLFKPLDEEDAIERLALASMLMRRLDEASVEDEP